MKHSTPGSASFLFAILAATLTGCVEPEPDELELGDLEQAIEGGSFASDWQSERAAKIVGCTATQIGAYFAITALHCNPRVGDPIRFYGTGVVATTENREITSVKIRAGTSIDTEDWTDLEGRLADFAVVEFSPWELNPYADLAWTYPGDGALGFVVGAGEHNGSSSLYGVLMQQTAETYSSSDNSGGFYTDVHVTNPGDSGGSFYVGNRLLGVTHGAHLIGVWRGRFTSVAEHLPFILGAIGWSWTGAAPQQRFRTGANVSLFYGTHQVCQYACDRTSSCAAYNWMQATSQCFLLSSVTGSVASSAYRSALK